MAVSTAEPLSQRHWRTALRGTAVALGGIIAGLLVAAVVVAAMAVTFFGYSVTVIQSDSMAPALEKGDIAVVRDVAIEDVQPRDIIQFNEPNTGVSFIHRVVGINTVTQNTVDGDTGELVGRAIDYQLTTRGDANPLNDAQPLGAQHVTGELWFSVPTWGFAANDIQLWGGIVAVSIAVLWAAWEGVRLLRRRGNASEEA